MTESWLNYMIWGLFLISWKYAFSCIMQTKSGLQIYMKTVTYELCRKHGVYLLVFVKHGRSRAAVLIVHTGEVRRGALCAGTCTLCRLQLVAKDDAISVVQLCGSHLARLWFWDFAFVTWRSGWFFSKVTWTYAVGTERRNATSSSWKVKACTSPGLGSVEENSVCVYIKLLYQ